MKYLNGNPIFKYPEPGQRFEIYYYNVVDPKTQDHKTYYYVNIHAKYTVDPIEIVDFLNRIVDTIQVYRDTKMRLNVNNVKSIRPGFGMHPKYYSEILGLTATKDIDRGTPLSWDLINKDELK
jgi:sialic acid synthase SpsE